MSARISAALAVALLSVPLVTGTAQAHEGNKPGSPCAMSGMAISHHGIVQVCGTNAAGKAVWGKVLTSTPAKLTISNGWVKAADSGMTAAFGVLKNPTSKAIRVIAVTTPYSPTQLHEVVDKDGEMVMQQKPGGFVIPANGSLELKPGGNHIMFMKVARPVKAGSMVPLTFITSDGGTMTAKVMGKVFTGGNETYDASSGTGMSMDMG